VCRDAPFYKTKRYLGRFQPRPLSPNPSHPSSVTATVSSSLIRPPLRCAISVSVELTMPTSSGRGVIALIRYRPVAHQAWRLTALSDFGQPVVDS